MPPRATPFLKALVITACAVVAVTTTVGAQEQRALFDRVDDDAGLDLVGGVAGAAWGDLDADGDLDLAVVDDGRLAVWRNDSTSAGLAFSRGAVDDPAAVADDVDVDDGDAVADPLADIPVSDEVVVTDEVAGEEITSDVPSVPRLTGVRWFDADSDGDADLLLRAESGDQRLLVNTAGVLGDPIVVRPNAMLGHEVADIDADGLLDVFAGAAETSDSVNSGVLVRRSESYAPTRIEGFLPGEDQSIASLYRAAVSDALELFSGGSAFPGHQFRFEATGPRYLGQFLDRSTLVRDVAVSDFDGDLINELFLLRSNPDAAIASNEDGTEITFLITARDSASSVTLGGVAEMEVEVIEQFNLPVFGIQFGAQRRQSDSYAFTVDSSVGGSTAIGDLDTGLFISATPSGGYRFVLAGTEEIRAQVRVTASEPIEVLQTVGLPRAGGALFDQFLERNGEDWTVAQLLPRSTECNAAATADFDNDGDVDIYMACGNSIENTANTVFLNDGAGEFSEVELGAGLLSEMSGALGVTAVDADSNGVMDLLVQSDGGTAGVESSALLQGRPNDNHWLGLRLVANTTEPSAIGASVVLETDGESQRRDALGGTHGEVQGDPRVHFGLGDVEIVERLVVTWPSGRRQVLDQVSVDQYLDLVEPARDTPFAELRLSDLFVEPVARDGDQLEIVATVQNLGTTETSSAVMTFELPTGWRAVGLDERVVVDGSTLQWPLPPVAPGFEATVSLAIRVEQSSGPGRVGVSVTGDFPTDRLSSEVVTAGSSDRLLGTRELLLALAAVMGVLAAAVLVIRRR